MILNILRLSRALCSGGSCTETGFRIRPRSGGKFKGDVVTEDHYVSLYSENQVERRGNIKVDRKFSKKGDDDGLATINWTGVHTKYTNYEGK